MNVIETGCTFLLLTNTGVTVEAGNGVMRLQFACLWTASAQREREDRKQYRHASFDKTWPLSLAPKKWFVRIIRTTMTVNIVTSSTLHLFQEWQSISTLCEPSLKYKKKEKKVSSLVDFTFTEDQAIPHKVHVGKCVRSHVCAYNTFLNLCMHVFSGWISL